MDEQLRALAEKTGAHVLERTSPKGQKFIGRCVKCGAENLTMIQANERCVGVVTFVGVVTPC
jgi:hypothetical protein